MLLFSLQWFHSLYNYFTFTSKVILNIFTNLIKNQINIWMILAIISGRTLHCPPETLGRTVFWGADWRTILQLEDGWQPYAQHLYGIHYFIVVEILPQNWQYFCKCYVQKCITHMQSNILRQKAMNSSVSVIFVI